MPGPVHWPSLATSSDRIASWHGSGEQVALRDVATHLSEPVELFGGLDAFGGGGDPQGVRQRDRRAHDLLGVLVRPSERLHERLVDLEQVPRESGQSSHRRPPGAEVIDREADAEVVQRQEDARCGVLRERALRHLDPQAVSGCTATR